MSSVTDLVRGMRDIRMPLLPVLLAALGGAGLYVFFHIAGKVRDAEGSAIDSALLLILRDPADPARPAGPAWLEPILIEITALGGYPVLVVMVSVVIGFLLVSRKFGPALFVFLSIASGTVASHLLKLFYERPRPDVVEHLVATHTPSFPSGHATMSTVVFLTLAALIVRLVDSAAVRVYVLAVALLLALAVGTSRIYLGVHWPTDVAAGWALGIAWASLSWLAVSALRYGRRRSPAQPKPLPDAGFGANERE